MPESSVKISKARKNNSEWKKYFTTKEISANHDYPFDFKNSNWYVTIIYLVTFLAIPIIYSFVKTYGYHITSGADGKLPAPWNNLEIVLTVFLPIIGAGIAFAVDWKAMAKRGGWAAYTHFLFGIISAFFVSLLLIQTGLVSGDANDPTYLAASFLVQVIVQFIGSLIVIFTNKSLRKHIVATFKEAKVDLLVWVIIFLALVSILNFAFNAISNAVNSNILADGSSDNQNQLEKMARTPFGAFALILGSIFLAPINEEISYRYGTFSIVRHKWIAFSASLIYFPAMHVIGNGDWNNIFGYLGMGIMAPLLFVSARGNTTYSIGLHMLLNTVATITLFVTMK